MAGRSIASAALIAGVLVFGARLGFAQFLGGWDEPPGGWDYVYEANDGEEVDGEFDPSLGGGSLDGTWTHSNGSDSWDGSGPEDRFRPDGVTPAAPGGAGIIIVPGAGDDGGDAEVLSIVDTGDPRTRGFSDPSNRKLWFCHDVLQEGIDGSNAVRDGITLIARCRLHPDVDPAQPGWQLPDGGVDDDAGQGAAPGYALRDGGKGGIGFYDAALDRIFSFVPHGTKGYQFPPQVGEGLPPANFLDVGDSSQFHSFWITISDPDGNDRYDIVVYLDGATEPAAVFRDVQLGDDTDCDGISHLHMGFHSTPQVGGIQVDYFGYKLGEYQPSSPCPGAFSGALDPETGSVRLAWAPVGTVDSYTIRRDGSPIAEGLAATADTYVDAQPPRPAATYELVPIRGGAPKPGCRIAAVAVSTVVCPELSASADRRTGEVTLSWTAPKFFSPTGYKIIRDGAVVGSAPGGATSYKDSPPVGEHSYELLVESDPPACAAKPFATARLFGPGAIEVAGDGWDKAVPGGVVRIAVTRDGVHSLYFPAVAKSAGDVAYFAAEVGALGTGEIAGGRYRVELRARFDNEVRITNRSVSPASRAHFNLSRTGVSTATDERGTQENVEQVPNPGDDPSIDSSSSTIVNTDAVGIRLAPGLNIFEIAAVDAAGTPHGDNLQIFEVRIGPFAKDLDAELAEFPCAGALSCSRDPVSGAVALTWSSPLPHAYEIRRGGRLIATIPLGAPTEFTDLEAGRGFFTYTLRVTDDPICPEISCAAGGGVLDENGAIRDWLILGPLDWGCPGSCANPGEDLIRGDYLEGTKDGSPVAEIGIEPEPGDEIQLARSTVRAAARADINPGAPRAAKWFPYNSPQTAVNYNAVFGADPGDNYMCYAACYVVNTTGADLMVDLLVASDDSVQVLLNGEEVWINNIARALDIGAPDIAYGVTLLEGTNRLLVKVFEGGGETGFALAFWQLGAPVASGIEVLVSQGGGVELTKFHRGDPNDDGAMNITDGIYVLNFLFLGGREPTCLESADVNDDGQLNITDGIYILNYLFLGGPEPAPPGDPAKPCGPDPAGSPDLGCEAYTRC